MARGGSVVTSNLRPKFLTFLEEYQCAAPALVFYYKVRVQRYDRRLFCSTVVCYKEIMSYKRKIKGVVKIGLL